MRYLTDVYDIGSAQNTLRAQKGFGALSVSTQELLMFMRQLSRQIAP